MISYNARDLLMKDFMSIETVSFTKDGGLDKTPAHNYTEFRFRTFAPFAFKKFREMFEIGEDDFLSSLCNLASPVVQLIWYMVNGILFIG